MHARHFTTGPRQAAGLSRNSGGLRIIRLVGMLALVVALMSKAGNPETWRWMWRKSPNTLPQQLAADPLTRAAPERNSTRELAAPYKDESRPRWLRQVDRKLLETIQDNTVFRPQETRVWFHLFGLLQDLPESELESHSNGRITYLQLLRQMDAYRGQLVDVQGTLRRAIQVRAAPNDRGIEHLWQCWLFLENGPREPVVVYALSLPEAAPRGTAIEAEVAVRGIAYKRWSFQSAEGLTVAPVLLTNTLRMRALPLSRLNPDGDDAPPAKLDLTTRVLGLGILGLLTAFWLMRRADRQASADKGLRQLRSAAPNVETGVGFSNSEAERLRITSVDLLAKVRADSSLNGLRPSDQEAS